MITDNACRQKMVKIYSNKTCMITMEDVAVAEVAQVMRHVGT